jgi:L,D-transpeptidase ErfK/SrfK
MTRIILFLIAGFVLLVTPHQTQAAYKKPYIGRMQTHIASADDTLVEIARKYGLGFVEARAANPHIDPWLPGKGAEIIIPTHNMLPDAPREGIVINIAEMRIYSYLKDTPESFPIAIGREGLETPEGETKVVRKKDGPTWRPTPRMIKEDPTLDAVYPPGPENPLGTHALYLGWPTYAIHGTNKPFGIGRRASSGCIRMYPEDIKEFFKIVPVGTKVTVINQPIKLAWMDGQLFLEAHPDLDQAIQMEETGMVTTHRMREEDMDLIRKAAGEHIERLDWATIRMAVRTRSGISVPIARNPNYVDGEDISEISPIETSEKKDPAPSYGRIND